MQDVTLEEYNSPSLLAGRKSRVMEEPLVADGRRYGSSIEYLGTIKQELGSQCHRFPLEVEVVVPRI